MPAPTPKPLQQTRRHQDVDKDARLSQLPVVTDRIGQQVSTAYLTALQSTICPDPPKELAPNQEANIHLDTPG